MDRRHRVYYLVNLNQNYRKQYWWSTSWDSYGMIYNRNLRILKEAVPSLKIRPSHRDWRSTDYYQMKVSCKWEEERLLRDTLDKLKQTNYEEILEVAEDDSR